MASAIDPTIEALLRAARTDYAAGLPAKLALLQSLVQAAAWRDARRAVHRLRGSATTYGFEALGALASVVEELLIEAGDELCATSRERVVGKLNDVRLEIERVQGETQ